LSFADVDKQDMQSSSPFFLGERLMRLQAEPFMMLTNICLVVDKFVVQYSPALEGVKVEPSKSWDSGQQSMLSMKFSLFSLLTKLLRTSRKGFLKDTVLNVLKAEKEVIVLEE
jgi:hypothetical protein